MLVPPPRAPGDAVGEVLPRHVEVDILRSTRRLRPRAAERQVLVLGRLEVEAERGEVRALRQLHDVLVRLGRPDERQEADHAELVGHHARRDVGHLAWGRNTRQRQRGQRWIVKTLTCLAIIRHTSTNHIANALLGL